MRLVGIMLLVMLAGVGRCWGQALEVAPVSITFGPGQQTASLTLTNRSAAPVTVQIRPFRWDEADGTAALSATTALAVSPPIAEIAPGQSQSVRMLLRAPPGQTEATYRLLVDQLPPAVRQSAVQIAIRVSLPVFAQPAGGGAAALEWAVEQGRRGASLRVHNRGTSHAVIVGVQVGAVAVRTTAHPYVLPGATVTWPIPGGQSWSGPVPLRVTSAAGASAATARVSSGP